MTLPEGSGPTVLLIGHCGFDSGGLTRFAQQTLPGARVARVNRQTDLDTLLAEQPCILLVNRVLDGAFTAATGTDLIASLNDTPNASCLLISNYPDAQQDAEQAGAHPGFGKSELGSASAADKLHAAASQHTA